MGIQYGRRLDFLEGCFHKTSEAAQTASESSSEQKEVKITRKVNGVVVDSTTESKQSSSSLNKDYLDAETLLDFLSIREDEKRNISQETKTITIHLQRHNTFPCYCRCQEPS